MLYRVCVRRILHVSGWLVCKFMQGVATMKGRIVCIGYGTTTRYTKMRREGKSKV
jgi:hypothetical protein